MAQFDINDKGLYRIAKERGQYSKLKWLIAHKICDKTTYKLVYNHNPFVFSATTERIFDKAYEEFLKKKVKKFGFFKKILYFCGKIIT